MYKVAQILQPGEGNAKVSHHGTDYKVFTISLASSDSSGHNTCPRALKRSVMEWMLDQGKDIHDIAAYANARGLSTCSGPCVTWEAGHGRTDHVRQARVNLTNWLFENPRSFKAYLLRQMTSLTKYHSDAEIACRPNVDSDVNWLALVREMFDFQWRFWDYTKCSERLGNVPSNYHLTYSVNDGTQARDWDRVYRTNSNIAVVFDSLWNPWGSKFGYLPATWTDPFGRVWPVVDGDRQELRFLDPVGVCVGLRLKGDEDKRDDACETDFVAPVGITGFDTVHPADAPVGHYLGV
ncbi:MAG: hypothetical protein EBT15_11760 [Betaproteobacteria bacterium]|nr:hypothetical protein [Betaproteobacteria bacterium]